jgi:hypothetical protein
VQTRAMSWIVGATVGSSSKAIWSTMMRVRQGYHGDYPHDPDDYWRCRNLLRLIPEWRERLHEMSMHGPVWKALVEHWDEIEALFVSEATHPDDRQWALRGGAGAKRTYDFMRSIIDPAEEVQGRNYFRVRV